MSIKKLEQPTLVARKHGIKRFFYQKMEVLVVKGREALHENIVNRDWKLGKLQSVYNELRFNVQTA